MYIDAREADQFIGYASFFIPMKGKVKIFVRKIYMYKYDGAKGQVDSFIKTSNIKIRKKFDFILRYIADERNQFKEP